MTSCLSTFQNGMGVFQTYTHISIEKIKRVFVHQAFGRDHMRIQYTKEGGE